MKKAVKAQVSEFVQNPTNDGMNKLLAMSWGHEATPRELVDEIAKPGVADMPLECLRTITLNRSFADAEIVDYSIKKLKALGTDKAVKEIANIVEYNQDFDEPGNKVIALNTVVDLYEEFSRSAKQDMPLQGLQQAAHKLSVDLLEPKALLKTLYECKNSNERSEIIEQRFTVLKRLDESGLLPDQRFADLFQQTANSLNEAVGNLRQVESECVKSHEALPQPEEEPRLIHWAF